MPASQLTEYYYFFLIVHRVNCMACIDIDREGDQNL
jgi:hypothetical protein